MFEETDGVFHNTIEYEKIAIKAQDNIMNIIFELGEDYKLSVGELFPKIISPDYNFGYTGNVSNSDLYESLLFEQSSVLFEEECARHMNNKKNVFSITGAMHVPYITENVLFIASSPEELRLILELTSRHFIMRNMLNKMSFEDSCTKYAKICNQLRSLYGTKVPIYYKNIFGHKNVKNVYF
jgi:hypothetical protein